MTPQRFDARSDEALVDAANGGEAAAFEALYLRYRDWAVRLAYRFTRNHEDALDVLQETFVYLLRKFPGFRLTAGMKTFLYPAVKNLSITTRRKGNRTISNEQILQEATAPTVDPDDSRQGLAALMSSLPAAQREALLLRFADGMTIAEIAAAVDVPEGTVKSRLHNGLERLRRDPRTRSYFEDA